MRRLLFLALAAAACGPKSGRSTQFPPEAKVERIALDPLPPGDPPDVADVEQWLATGPFPSTHGGEARRTPDAWDALLDGNAKTEAMRCVAGEIARFRVKHRAAPSADLERWIAARCGASVSSIVVSYQETDVPRLVGDEGLREGAAASVRRAVEELKAFGPVDLGIGFARDDSHAVILVAAGVKKAEFSPLAFAATGPIVRIEGSVLDAAESIHAITTRGKLATVECDHDPAAQPPRFSFLCAIDPGDREVRIDVVASPRGRLLAFHVASFVVFSGKPVDQWTRAMLPPSSGAATDAILASVNSIRQANGMRPVRLAADQTAVMERIAPHWFASVWGTANHRQETADLIALGLMAGWRVDGDVKRAKLTSSWVAHSTDPSRLVASSLEWPFGRAVIMDPEVDALAIGSLSGGSRPVLAAVITGYELREKEEHDVLLRAIDSRLSHARAPNPVNQAQRLAGFENDERVAAARVEEGKDPHAVLRGLMKKVSTKTSRAVRGWVIETSDLRELQLPSELAEEKDLRWTGAVAWRKPPGEPWGRYVVLVVTPN